MPRPQAGKVANLIDMLIAMGGTIEGRSTGILVVHGVKSLHGAEVDIIPDRIETGTYLVALGAAGGELTLTGCDPSHLSVLLEKLRGGQVLSWKRVGMPFMFTVSGSYALLT